MTSIWAAATSPRPAANPTTSPTAHPDGTSQVTSPAGKIIRSHSPPPRPG